MISFCFVKLIFVCSLFKLVSYVIFEYTSFQNVLKCANLSDKLLERHFSECIHNPRAVPMQYRNRHCLFISWMSYRPNIV